MQDPRNLMSVGRVGQMGVGGRAGYKVVADCDCFGTDGIHEKKAVIRAAAGAAG